MSKNEEIKADFERFLRHEAMRLNILRDDVENIVKQCINQ